MRYILLFTLIAKITLAQGSLIWQKSNTELPANGYSWSTPLIMDHKLIWAGQDKAIAALDEATGDILWVDSVNFPMGTYDSPVGFDGKAFIGKGYDWDEIDDKAFFALDVETGNIVWKKTGFAVAERSSKPIDKTSKTIFVACADTLYCLNINDGSVVWQKAAKYSNLLLDNDGTRLFASRRDTPLIEVLNSSNGQELWNLPLLDEDNYITGMAYTDQVTSDYLILMPDWNWSVDSQYVYCVNLPAKNIAWKSNLIGNIGNISGPAILGDNVYAGTQMRSDTAQNIVAFSLLTGNIIWKKPARNSGSTNSPYIVALDGKVYYEYTLNDSYLVVCADAETGEELWSTKPTGEFEWWPISWGSPVLYNNKLFVPTDGGGLYCYDAGQVNGSWLMVSANINATNCYVPGLVTQTAKVSNIIGNDYSLEQNYPNPFNPSTNISFSIPEEGFVNLIVYNSIGQRVTTLVSQHLQSGNYKTEFNAQNFSSGIYFYTLEVNGHSISKKMILIK